MKTRGWCSLKRQQENPEDSGAVQVDIETQDEATEDLKRGLLPNTFELLSERPETDDCTQDR